MKRIIKLLKRIVASFLYPEKDLIFVPFLQNGTYYYDGKRLVKFSLISIFRPCFYLNKKSRIKTKNKVLKLRGGTVEIGSKYVLVTNKYVVNVCRQEEYYFIVKQNIVNNIGKLISYPVNNNIRFYDDYFSYVSSYIEGKIIIENMPNDAIIRMIIHAIPKQFDYFDKSKNIIYSYQHGDLYARNILWVDNETFNLIDYDFIASYPALYDFFCYLFTFNYISNPNLFLESDYVKELVFDTLNQIAPNVYDKETIIDFYLAIFIEYCDTVISKLGGDYNMHQHLIDHCSYMISSLKTFNFESFLISKREYDRATKENKL